MRPLETAIERPVATSLLMAGLTIFGAIAFFLLPVAPVPQIDYPMITVSANMPGASPQTMASTVATPLERRLGLISSVNEMTSTSSLGTTRVSLQFNLDRDINGAQRDVQAAIAAARADLPLALRSNPTTRATGPADVPVLTLALTSDTLSQGQLFEAASNVLQQPLSQVPGVSQVSVNGGSLPAVRVELNPNALFKYALSLEDVRLALSAANYNAPKGELISGERRLQIYSNDQLRRAEHYKNLVIAHRDGAIIRLHDVANVIDSVEDSRSFGLVDDIPGIQVNVSRAPGANNIEVADKVKALLPALTSALPADAVMRVMRDRTLTIRSSLHEVERGLILAIAFVIMTVFLFLRDWRATLVPSISVFVSLIGSFGAMYLLDYTLDNLSLMALTIATGFVVDDAIVVVENIVRHIEAGETRRRAVLEGSREVAFTVLSMSLSLLAVFMPILLMDGFVGRMLREFAVTLSVAILISLALSVSATPMLCAQILRAHSRNPSSRILRASESALSVIQRGYETSLGFALARPRLTMATLFTTVALNVYLFTIIPKGFFPTQDTGRMHGALVADQSVSFQAMQKKLEQAIEIVRSDAAIATAAGTIGGSFFGPGGSINTADMQVTLKPLAERNASVDEVLARLRAKASKISGASLYLQSTQDVRIGGRSSNALYQYTLQSDNLDELQAWAPRVLEALRRNPVLQDVNSDQQDRGLQTNVEVDREAARRFNLTTSLIDNTLYDAYGQRQISTIYEPLNQYHVVMELAPKYRESIASLSEIFIGAGAAGAASLPKTGARSETQSAAKLQSASMVPLLAFSRVAPGKASLQVNHQGNFAATTISFNLSVGKSLSDATTAIKETMDAIGAPATLRGAFAGTAASYQDSLANQPMLIAAALATVYIVLGMLYESFLHPITILSTLPSAGVGALLALMACNTDLSIVAMIGVLLLIGIVKKNAIMLVDFAIDSRRRFRIGADDAIRRACAARFRPIVMTTLVALFSAVPLAFGTGEGAEIRRPLGIAVIGGLIVSQLLTLYTTPVVFLYIDRLQNWLLTLRIAPPRSTQTGSDA
ncbi:efflux RND transporter permease subunit [Methylocystis parvus]|uniref:Multidrug transporter subunit MdtC n=1 Tax=Methylocystis parvus TaxID=134 RepID=A0A6B8M4V1_9HYPH|nr:efflux RND transporter permease subunit [Methylocystis parvus]QGM97406.1 multidrug transporter subunit MdtC [Methylocystis parvus]WBJ98681.1 efflux RND transporter permease subunit [Methylocystis parvus OBBP]